MPLAHSLALPLAVDFAHATREEYSFFTTSTSPIDGPDAYLDALCLFLRQAPLIQSHPDNYFQFLQCSDAGGGGDGGGRSALSLTHLGPSPVEAEELAHTQTLLRAFQPLLQGDDVMLKLRTLVRDGPPTAQTAALAPLQHFYAETRRLMLHRTRRPDSDAASVTLLTEAERRAVDRTSSDAVARRQHERDILDLVVAHGMNPKKQHEVRIMRETIRDLVQCCNAGATSALGSERVHGHGSVDGDGATASARVQTTINIGEGKGYVSRAVALCDNLQVVGLDCNPAHKERAVERFESLLETSLSATRDGRPRVNLLYEPRGHVASIACRVEGKVRWTELLQGHVRTCPDSCCGSCDGNARGGSEAPADAPSADASAGAEDEAVVVTRVRGGETVKLACRVCAKVVRQESTTVIMKHIYTHLRGASSKPPCASHMGTIPTLEEVQQWNVQLSQHAYVAKLTERFFTVADVEERHLANRKDAAALKRVRAEASGKADSRDAPSALASETAAREATGSASRAAADSLALTRRPRAEPEADGNQPAALTRPLEPAYTARGYRAELLVATPDDGTCPLSSGNQRIDVEGKKTDAVQTCEPACSEEAAPAPVPVTLPQPPTWSFKRITVTIAGYDGGADSHQVCLGGEAGKHTLRLYHKPTHDLVTPTSLTHATSAASQDVCTLDDSSARVGEWQLPAAEVWGRARAAMVLSVQPPAQPSTPAVYVPTVRNTVLIGLHPCGDLGSNVCRIFCDSAARGLLLVSCCWHALTPHGFPLSAALQRRGLTTDNISLLLATQPLDAWATASPEGHRSSAKLLFFRSLFKLLWSRLAAGWAAAIGADGQHGAAPGKPRCAHVCGVAQDGDGSDSPCAFPAMPPHLEPTFLRRVTRDKETITFAQFVHTVAAEYVYAESAKVSPYTPWHTGRGHCAECRAAQEAYVRRALTEQRLAEEMGATYEREHFASFLGLTVLRMWMCHLVESLLLLDRTLFLHERLSSASESSAVALVPLFDGALSPRMYGIFARRGGSA